VKSGNKILAKLFPSPWVQSIATTFPAFIKNSFCISVASGRLVGYFVKTFFLGDLLNLRGLKGLTA
jgi:hypothetical protein